VLQGTPIWVGIYISAEIVVHESRVMTARPCAAWSPRLAKLRLYHRLRLMLDATTSRNSSHLPFQRKGSGSGFGAVFGGGDKSSEKENSRGRTPGGRGLPIRKNVDYQSKPHQAKRLLKGEPRVSSRPGRAKLSLFTV